MKTICKAFILTVAVSMVLIPSSITFAEDDPPPAGPLAEIQAVLAQLQTQLAGLQTSMSALTQDVADLEEQLDTLATAEDLRGLSQNWDKRLDATNGEADGCDSDRFTCLFDGTVVRDNETGIVWDRNPDPLPVAWSEAVNHCADRSVGGRKGFQLPTVAQLSSIIDDSNRGPALPTGHPFMIGDAAGYWAATTANLGFPDNAWAVDNLPGDFFIADKSFLGVSAWCVRGGESLDGQVR